MKCHASIDSATIDPTPLVCVDRLLRPAGGGLFAPCSCPSSGRWTSLFFVEHGPPAGEPVLAAFGPALQGRRNGLRNVWTTGCGSCSCGSSPLLACRMLSLSSNGMLSAKWEERQELCGCPTGVHGVCPVLTGPVYVSISPYSHVAATPGHGHGSVAPYPSLRLIHGENDGPTCPPP